MPGLFIPDGRTIVSATLVRWLKSLHQRFCASAVADKKRAAMAYGLLLAAMWAQPAAAEHGREQAHTTGAQGRGQPWLVQLEHRRAVPAARMKAEAAGDECIHGYVWREAFRGDRVCVTPETRRQAANDNRQAAARRDPGGGRYGQDTCRQGYVWREAGPNDRVCVTPAIRQAAAQDNAKAAQRIARGENRGGFTKPSPPPPLPQQARKLPPPSPEPGAPAKSEAPPKSASGPAAKNGGGSPPPADRNGDHGPPDSSGAPAATAGEATLAQFPWPPPQAHSRYKLSRSLLAKQESGTTLGDVADRLEAALQLSGYSQSSYFAVKDGYALVTKVEQMDADGTPKQEPARWEAALGPLSISNFTLDGYLKALFNAARGYYRVIVFIVSPHPIAEGETRVSRSEAEAWLHKGADRLPRSLRALSYGADFECTALIYEFEQTAPGQQARLRENSPLTGEAHLRKSKILTALTL